MWAHLPEWFFHVLVLAALLIVGCSLGLLWLLWRLMPPKCPRCGAALLFRDKLLERATSLHGGVLLRKYTCPQCEYARSERLRTPRTKPPARLGRELNQRGEL